MRYLAVLGLGLLAGFGDTCDWLETSKLEERFGHLCKALDVWTIVAKHTKEAAKFCDGGRGWHVNDWLDLGGVSGMAIGGYYKAEVGDPTLAELALPKAS